MIRRSNRLAAKRPPPPPGPDRLSVIPQELFLRICDYLVDDENDLVMKFGLTRFFGHIHPVSLAKGLRSLHCASKLLRDKTSTSICKLGFVMTVPGLKALLRMAGEPQIAPYVIHVRLLIPAQMWLYHKETRARHTQVVDLLTDCFLRLTNLRKVELSGIKSQVPQNHVVDMPDQYSWSVGLLLCALHVSKACVTELIYDEGTEVMPPSSRNYHLNPLPPAWLSNMGNIEKFRAVEHEDLWRRRDAYAEQMLRAMSKLTELTVTPKIPATRSFARQRVNWRGYYEFPGWVKVALQCRYDWRLTAFHASHFEVESANSLKRFLRTHSPTLRDLNISEVIVTDSNHFSEIELVARSFWTEIFRIILDDMNLRKGKFHDLLYLIPEGPGHHMSVAMYWEQNDDSVLDVFGRKFEDVAKVRGMTRALADWMDGMVMVAIH